MLFVYKILILVYFYKVNAYEEDFINKTFVIPEKKNYELNDAAELFQEFVNKFNKQYKDVKEYQYRFNVFKNTLKVINSRNQINHGEVYGITEFADLTLYEFIHGHTGLNTDLLPNKTALASRLHFVNLKIPEKWDWRDKGLVTPARDQYFCQSCWAFSAVGCVEGQYAKKYGVLLPLSDQQLVDCYKGTCQAGDWPHKGMNAAAQMGGFMLAQDYPYIGFRRICRFQKNKAHVKIKGGQEIQGHDENYLKQILYQYGPVSVGMHANIGFQYYTGGIATARGLGCSPYAQINHAVLLVGYGTENNIPYWIIKNSAGSSWGEDGFMRLTRGQNTCSISDYAAIATL